MILPLDGPSAQDALTVTNAAVQEVKVAASPLAERKVVTIQPISDNVYIFFADAAGSTPSVANMQSKGFVQYRGAKDTYEASDSQKVFILAVSTTTQVIVAERA